MHYRTQKTSKLFYKKWTHKIECWCRESWLIKSKGVAETLERCRLSQLSNKNKWANLYYMNRDDAIRLEQFATVLAPFLDKDLQLVSTGTLSIYCKDLDLYTELVAALDEFIIAVIEPSNDTELQFLTDNGHKKILCNRLPHHKYNYKITFNPLCNADVKRRFESWIHNYGDKVRIPKSTAYWFMRGWRPSPFIYVEDKSTLAMIGLFMGQDVKKIEEYITRSSINISLDQDNSCQHLAKV